MFSSFIIILREGFESFLLVAVILFLASRDTLGKYYDRTSALLVNPSHQPATSRNGPPPASSFGHNRT